MLSWLCQENKIKFELAVLRDEFIMRECPLHELLGKPHFLRFPNGSFWFILDSPHFLSRRVYFWNKISHATTWSSTLRTLWKYEYCNSRQSEYRIAYYSKVPFEISNIRTMLLITHTVLFSLNILCSVSQNRGILKNKLCTERHCLHARCSNWLHRKELCSFICLFPLRRASNRLGYASQLCWCFS